MFRLISNFSLKYSDFTKRHLAAAYKCNATAENTASGKAGKLLFIAKATIVLFLFLCLPIQKSFGQRDQLTTQAGEKIRCRILDETPTRFVYAYVTPSGKVLRNEIFKNLVTDFKYDFYPEDIVTKGNKAPAKQSASPKPESKPVTTTAAKQNPKTEKESVKPVSTKKPEENKADDIQTKTKGNLDKEEKEVVKKPITQKDEQPIPVSKKPDEKVVAPLATKKAKSEYDNYLKFRVGARGGFGNMLTKLDTKDEYGLYQEKLLRGWTWGADFAYFPKENFGFGIMFNQFQSKNSANNIDFKFRKNGEEIDTTGNLSNKRSATFVGPVFYFRKNIDFKTMVILGLSPGAYFYNDKGTYNNVTIPYKGWDFGGAATLGIDFLLGNDITGRDVILSLEAGYNYGKIRSMNFNDGNGTVKLDKPIDLSRLDFTIGLRFMRYPRYLRN